MQTCVTDLRETAMRADVTVARREVAGPALRKLAQIAMAGVALISIITELVDADIWEGEDWYDRVDSWKG